MFIAIRNKKQNEKMFYHYQNELKNLNNMVDRLKNYSHEVNK